MGEGVIARLTGCVNGQGGIVVRVDHLAGWVVGRQVGCEQRSGKEILCKSSEATNSHASERCFTEPGLK